MKLTQHDRLVMIGDSITDCQRARPIGEGSFPALGYGYVTQVEALLSAVYPQLGIRVTNTGISGHTVRHLKERWQTDVLDLKPDWLSIMIGINDVWRQFDEPTLTEKHVYLEEYEQTLTELVATTRPRVKGLVLMSPFFIEPNRQDPMRAMTDRYSAVVKQVAAAHDAIFVDTQAAFDEALTHYYSASLARDRVHPSQAGHMLITRAFLKAIDFSWEGQ